MARKLNLGMLVVAAVAAALLNISAAQKTYVVGGALGWTVPPGGAITYSTWAAPKTFIVGDTLVFNFATGMHSVAEVSKAAFDSCNTTSPISLSTNGPTNITLKPAGTHYYICTFAGHCGFGQKLAINVATSTGRPTPTPVSALSPKPATAPVPPQVATPAAAPAPTSVPQTYIVGDALGWTVPPGGPVAYRTWTSNKSFRVGDTLVFNFVNGTHNVATVSKAAYDSCNTSSPMNTITAGPARIRLTNSGEHFYICTFTSHCSLGQKLAINVTGTTSVSAPSGSPSAPTPSSTPSMDSPVTPPPSPSGSAPSLALAALPITFLAIALALLN